MCGIVGIVACSPVNQALYDALIMLQHRGQDAAGIVTSTHGRFFMHKNNGLVANVFKQEDMQRLYGTMGIAHVRYPTAGTSSSAEAQPLYVNSPYGIVLAHNGNLTNAVTLMKEVQETHFRHINTCSDSEVLLNIFAHELSQTRSTALTSDHIFQAIRRTHQRVKGAYAVVAMISGYGLIAFRDPYAIRPLIYGERLDAQGRKEYMVASESVALEAQGFRIVRDLAPAEAIIITEDGRFFSEICAEHAKRVPCIFEYVYFARSDSTIDGINVYKARLRMGEKLAQQIQKEWADHDIDAVIPIPDTSRPAALALAKHLGVEFREGFMKNRYIGRTFIMPEQAQRERSVRQKLSPLPLEFRDKNVLLVDDSIVRGTTSEQIIQLARESGAKKVYFASAAPAVRFPNVYGIDMPTHEELIAYQRDTDEVAALIGADKVIYQTLPDLLAAVITDSSAPQEFDCSVFNGCYVTGDIDDAYLRQLVQQRDDQARARITPINPRPLDLLHAHD